MTRVRQMTANASYNSSCDSTDVAHMVDTSSEEVTTL
jgi:hypothetical protein